MKIYLTNGGSISVDEQLAKELKDKFANIAGRPTSNGFIEVHRDGALFFALNKDHVMYIK